jgi:FkbM family methyltransferase
MRPDRNLKKMLIHIGESGMKSKRLGRLVNTYFYFKNYSDPRFPLWPREKSLSVQSKRFYDDNILCGDEKIREKFRRLTSGLDDQSVMAAERFYRADLYIARHNYSPDNLWIQCTINSYQSHQQAIKTKYQGMEIPPYINLTEEVHLFDMGLRFVPDDIVREKQGIDVIDGGAYMGDSALVFEKFYNPSRIFTFEPIDDNYSKLLETIAIMKLKKVIPIRKGLSGAKATAKIVVDGSASYIGDGSQEIEVTDIDSFVEENSVTPGIIKMDIEGSEYAAITGAIKTIRQFRPILLISIYHSPTDFFEIKPLLEQSVADYTFRIVKLRSTEIGRAHV